MRHGATIDQHGAVAPSVWSRWLAPLSLAGACVLAVLVALGTISVKDQVIMVVTLLATVGAVMAGSARYRSTGRPSIGAGLVLGACMAVAVAMLWHLQSAPPSPTGTLRFGSLSTPLVLVLLVAITDSCWTPSDRSHRLDVFLDYLLAGLVVGTVAIACLLPPSSAPEWRAAEQALLIEYGAITVVLLLAGWWQVRARHALRTPAMAFLGLSGAAILAANGLALAHSLGSAAVTRSVFTACLLVAMGGIGAAAVHPSIRRLAAPPSRPAQGFADPLRRCIDVVCLLVAGTAVWASLREGAAGRWVAVALTAAAAMVVAARLLHGRLRQRRSQARLRHQAHHDPLTGAWNRRAGEERLDQAMADRPEVPVGVLYLDVDRFKDVNDVAGHVAADAVLVEVARRLAAVVRDEDAVARVGGDEFMLVLPGTGPGSLQAAAARVHAQFRPTVDIGGRQVRVTVSLGAAALPGRTEDAARRVVARADRALAEAKRGGRNRWVVWDEALARRTTRKTTLAADLRDLLANLEAATAVEDHGGRGGPEAAATAEVPATAGLHLVYQPIVTVDPARSRTVVAMEAFLRWVHPIEGPIPPDEAVTIAAGGGVLRDLEEWVLSEACQDLAMWRRSSPGLRDLLVAVNLTGASWSARLAPGATAAALEVAVHRSVQGAGIPMSSVCLEVSEEVLTGELGAPGGLLSRLREAGVRLAVDDFGSGEVSLARLAELPPDYLKIDRSSLGTAWGPDDRADMDMAIVAMARALGIQTVGERVEDPVEAARLIQIGCDCAQGSLYGQPVTSASVPAMIRSLRLRPAGMEATDAAGPSAPIATPTETGGEGHQVATIRALHPAARAKWSAGPAAPRQRGAR